MIHIKKEIKDHKIMFDLIPKNHKIEDFVFFDIETTGLDSMYSRLTVAGMFYFEDGKWMLEQLFTEVKSDEPIILKQLHEILVRFKTIVTYNGNRFDLKYVSDKFKTVGINGSYLMDKSLDIFLLVKKIKKKYNFANCKLKTIEKHVGIDRKNFIEGEQIVDWYSKAINGSMKHRDELLLYNGDDVIYLAKIMGILSKDFFEKDGIVPNEPSIIKSQYESQTGLLF